MIKVTRTDVYVMTLAFVKDRYDIRRDTKDSIVKDIRKKHYFSEDLTDWVITKLDYVLVALQ